jgi:AraC-like DNA-binding protein
MKILPFKIPKSKDETLIYQEDVEYVFYNKLHQHEEIQISYIKSGEGTILIGDTFSHYEAGEIIVIGSNLPHVFRSELHVDFPSVMQTIFFTRNSFGKHFFDLPEFKVLTPFFEAIKNGFKINKPTAELVSLFDTFKNQDEYNRVITFLTLLGELNSHFKNTLSNFVYDKVLTDVEGKRMQLVFEYVMNNYHENIELSKIASLSNMSKNAFCRYFKARTNKTFFQFLIEIRIEHAAKLLLKNADISIVEISETCGYNNISNFNRKFKEIKGLSPLSYRKKFQSQ